MNDLTIDSEMRRRLSVNRDGNLTSDQWLKLSLVPMTPVLFVFIPAVLLLTVRFRMAGFLVALLGGLGLLLIFVTQRLSHYARLPLSYEVMTASKDHRGTSKGQFDFVDERDEMVRFSRHITDGITSQRGSTYHVYYLVDGHSRVLLSMAPYAEDDTRAWEPTAVFKSRYEKRVQDKPKGKPKRH